MRLRGAPVSSSGVVRHFAHNDPRNHISRSELEQFGLRRSPSSGDKAGNASCSDFYFGDGGAATSCWANALTQGDWRRLQDIYGKAVAIDVEMLDQRDEAVVLRYLQIEIKLVPNVIDIDRRQINTVMGQCGSHGVVAAKCQELLRLHDTAASFVEGISRKLGR